MKSVSLNDNMGATRGGEEHGTRLRFWGVRGSIPTPGTATVSVGGNTSCVEVRTGGQIVVLDAGSGIRPLGLALMKEFAGAPIELTLLITHTHWDHIQGFPFFAPAYDAPSRVRILGYEGARRGLAATLGGQMESPYFPIPLEAMPGSVAIEELRDMQFTIGSMPAEACLTNHPGMCVGYKLHTEHGAIVYMPDHETRASETPTDANDERIATFIAGAEVLIIDTQYTADEYATHVNWGHGCLDAVVRLAVAAKVRRLFTFHHDPAHDDAFVGAMLEHARKVAQSLGSGLQIEAAREGAELVLSPARLGA